MVKSAMLTERLGGGPLPEQLVVPSFPQVVLLDLTNVCNLSCVHCAQPLMRKEEGYRARMMSLALFKKIADEMAKHPDSLLRIIGDGEPLIVPELPAMIEYAKAKGVRGLGITTAGFHLTETKSRRFLEAGLDFIDFSLDAATSETYGKIRVGSNFEKVTANIGRFLDLRREIQGSGNYTGTKTKVLVNMIDQPMAHAEIPAFHQLWKSRVDRVFVRPLHSVVGLVNVDNPMLKINTKRWPCRYFWERLEVSPDGRVAHCSQAWGRESAYVGNANKQQLVDIWKSPIMEDFRERHLKGNFPENSICYSCMDWKAISWKPEGTYAAHMKDLLGP